MKRINESSCKENPIGKHSGIRSLTNRMWCLNEQTEKTNKKDYIKTRKLLIVGFKVIGKCVQSNKIQLNKNREHGI